MPGNDYDGYQYFPQGDPNNTFGDPGGGGGSGGFSELYGLGIGGVPAWLRQRWGKMPNVPMPQANGLNDVDSALAQAGASPGGPSDLSPAAQAHIAAGPQISAGPYADAARRMGGDFRDWWNKQKGFNWPPQSVLDNPATYGGDVGGATVTLPQFNVTPANAAPAPQQGGGGGIGSDANFPVMGAGGFPTTYAAPGQQPPAPGVGPAGGRTRASPGAAATAPPAASAGPGRTAGAPNLGYGIPNDRFKTLQYDVAGTPGATQMPGGAGRAGQNRNPYITSLNLGSLFGGGQPQQAAANPANVASPAAQPVSASRPPGGGTINLPANYNLPGSGYYMTPGGDVGGTRYPSTPAGAPPTLAAYQQWLRARGVRV